MIMRSRYFVSDMNWIRYSKCVKDGVTRGGLIMIGSMIGFNYISYSGIKTLGNSWNDFRQ